MPKRIKRITIYRKDHPWLSAREAVLDRLRERDLLSVRGNGTISVYPFAAAEDLSDEEREVVYFLLGYEQPDPQSTPLIVRRAGVVGGRALIAGTHIPVWRLAQASDEGATPADLRRAIGLSEEEIRQALVYAQEHQDEIRRDILDNELAVQGKAGAWL
jgi:uncharacterized protein (DUF433 family)